MLSVVQESCKGISLVSYLYYTCCPNYDRYHLHPLVPHSLALYLQVHILAQFLSRFILDVVITRNGNIYQYHKLKAPRPGCPLLPYYSVYIYPAYYMGYTCMSVIIWESHNIVTSSYIRSYLVSIVLSNTTIRIIIISYVTCSLVQYYL